MFTFPYQNSHAPHPFTQNILHLNTFNKSMCSDQKKAQPAKLCIIFYLLCFKIT